MSESQWLESLADEASYRQFYDTGDVVDWLLSKAREVK